MTEKVNTGNIGLQYVNQSGEVVGSPISINYDKSMAVVDEGIPFTSSISNSGIPTGYHNPSPSELATIGKTQPTEALTGMEGVNDPRLTDYYVYGDLTNISVNFVNVKNNSSVGTSPFSKNIGDKIDLSTTEFTSKIPSSFHYASNAELGSGQTQNPAVTVAKDGTYTVFVAEEKTLTDEREAAKEAVRKAAADRTTLINNVDGALDADRQKAIDEVASYRDEALAKLDTANTSANIQKEKNTGIDNINSVKLPKSSVEIAREDAKKAVDEAAKAKNDLIDNIVGANPDEVVTAKAKVEEERVKANTAIDNALTVNDVETEKNTGIENINNVENPKSGLELQIDKSKAAIDEAAKKKLAEIEAVVNPEPTELALAKTKVEAEKQKAYTAIEASGTEEEVKTAETAGVAAIEGIEIPSTLENIAKENGKKAVDEAAKKKLEEIEAVVNPDPVEKQAAIDKVAEEKEKAYNAIDAGTTVEIIEKAITDGVTAIEEIEVPRTLENIAKEKGKEDIEQAAKDKIDEINNVPGATEEDKQKAIDEVNEIKDKAIEDIDKSTTVDEVETVVEKGKEDIANVVNPPTDVEKARTDAINEVEEAAKKKLEEIEAVVNPNLEEKAKAIEDVNKYKDEAIDEINASGTVEEVTTARDKGIDNINKVEVPRTLEEIAKEKGKEEIEDAADKKKEEIDKTPGATDEDKQKAKDEVDEIKDKAIEDVDKSTTVEEIENVVDKGKEDIEDVIVDITERKAIIIGGTGTVSEKVETSLTDFSTNRFSGKDRYETAVEVSKEMYPDGAKTVVLASGQQYSDELTATVYADALNAPVLLVRGGSLPVETAKEMRRLGANKVVMIGGTGTISSGVERILKADYNVERISGINRFETAVKIAEELKIVLGKDIKEVALVDGMNFPDAVAMTSYGVNKNIPILLTKTNSLGKETEELIKKFGVEKVTIGGGTGSVSKAIETKINKEGIGTERISGVNRYETAVKIAEKVYGKSQDIVIASGEVFPDATVGAPLAAKKGYPILLVSSKEIPQVVKEYINK